MRRERGGVRRRGQRSMCVHLRVCLCLCTRVCVLRARYVTLLYGVLVACCVLPFSRVCPFPYKAR